MKSVAVLGTGLLGEAIAQRCLSQGSTVHAWNRTRERIQPLLALGAREIGDLSEVSTTCDTVITVLRDGPVTANVVAELGALHHTTAVSYTHLTLPTILRV